MGHRPDVSRSYADIAAQREGVIGARRCRDARGSRATGRAHERSAGAAMSEPLSDVDVEGARELTEQLARLAVEQAAPDEMLTFDEVAEDYFADPAGTLAPKRADEPVGFGLELALMTPIALAVAQFVVKVLADLLSSSIKEAAEPSLTSLLRRILRMHSEESGMRSATLTLEQRNHVFTVARREAERLGLPAERATLLGLAIVGAMDIEVA